MCKYVLKFLSICTILSSFLLFLIQICAIWNCECIIYFGIIHLLKLLKIDEIEKKYNRQSLTKLHEFSDQYKLDYVLHSIDSWMRYNFVFFNFEKLKEKVRTCRLSYRRTSWEHLLIVFFFFLQENNYDDAIGWWRQMNNRVSGSCCE